MEMNKKERVRIPAEMGSGWTVSSFTVCQKGPKITLTATPLLF